MSNQTSAASASMGTPGTAPADQDQHATAPAAPVPLVAGSVSDIAPGMVPGAASARILIVDDEEANVRLLHRMLERAGFTDLHSTTDPGRVLALVAAVEPDVVLLDLRMPEHDGFAVLRDLTPFTRGDGPRGHLPVLMLTGDTSTEVKRQALALGAKDFVAKPFDPPEVLLRIRNLLETRLLYRALRAQNAALEGEVQERTRAFEEAQREVLQRLAQAAELRDDDTGLHTQRVGELSARIATAMGLPDAEVALLRQAAPLHDVGKIGVPDAVLLKPDRLTADERRIMQRHTIEGARILSGSASPLTRMAEVIALAHHERWDGAGYPQRLAGEAIPLVARIVAVADVVDALAHDRPYRAAWPRERVVAHVRDGSGSHFDPDVVAAFLELEFAPASEAGVAESQHAASPSVRPVHLTPPRDRTAVLTSQKAVGRLRVLLRQQPVSTTDVLAQARECGRCAYAAGMGVDAMADVLAGLALPEAYRTRSMPEAIIDAALEAYLAEAALSPGGAGA